MERGDDAERPAWWDINQEIRDRYDLPEYDAPRFACGTYTYHVVPELEQEYECQIRFIAIDIRYPDDWSVRIDNEFAFTLPIRRTKSGNAIYQISALEFRAKIAEYLD